jgi:two-component system sensor histidine kinase/response regulator
VLQRIREQSPRYGTPKVIMVTAYGREEVMKRAQSSGLDGFLIKPATQSTLFDALMAAAGADTGRRSTGRIEASQVELLNDIRGARVLVAEDNEINRQVAREILEQGGFAVDLSHDGVEAVEAIKRTRYDAVLMDIQMPRLDGLAATREIRAWEARESRSAIPIIAMTAHAMAGDAEKSLAAGMNDHVTKPINPDRVFAALAKAVQPRPGIGRDAAPIIRPAPPGEAVTLPAELPGIDREDGLRRIGGNTSLYRDILVRLATDFGGAAEQMERLLADGQLDGAARLAHSLKGIAGNIGAKALSAAAAQAEAACMTGSEAERVAAARAMAAPLRIVVDGLAGLKPAAAPPASRGGAVSDLPAALRENLSRAASSADIDRLYELLAQVTAHDAPLAAELRRLVDDFEYEALQKRLDG